MCRDTKSIFACIFAVVLNSFWPSDAMLSVTGPGRHWYRYMACLLSGAKPLPEPMLTLCKLDIDEYTSVKFESKHINFYTQEWNLQISSANNHFVMC